MKQVLIALLYTAGVWLANPALADVSAASALRDGDMKKLNFHSEPKQAGSATFTDFEGTAELALSDYEGKWVLVNFWATWCAPCRKEMPHLAELQYELGGDDFEVVTIATGRNPPAGMKKFFSEIGVDNLPMHRDPKSALARDGPADHCHPEPRRSGNRTPAGRCGLGVGQCQGDSDHADRHGRRLLTLRYL